MVPEGIYVNTPIPIFEIGNDVNIGRTLMNRVRYRDAERTTTYVHGISEVHLSKVKPDFAGGDPDGFHGNFDLSFVRSV